MIRGKYIVLEGPSGVGKTTQMNILSQRLQAARLPVRIFREPDSQSDITARAIRRITQDKRFDTNANAEVLLHNAARAQSLQVIKKSVEHGVVCIVDRNYLSTLAYQYYGRGDIKDYETINRIIAFAVNGVEPDLCIVLDAPVVALKEHMQARYANDRYDNLDPAFLERVRAGYLWEAQQRHFPVIYVNDGPEETAEEIWKLVSATLAVRDPAKGPSQPEPLKAILEDKKLSIPHEPPLGLHEALANQAAPALNQTVRVDDSTAPQNYKISYLFSEVFVSAANQTGAELSFQSHPDMAVNYPFYIPPSLPEALRGQYTATIIEILSLHTRMAQKLTQRLDKQNGGGELSQSEHLALRTALPVAVQRITTVQLAGQAKTRFDELLAASNSPEANAAAASAPASTDGLREITAQLLPAALAAESDNVVLVDYWPRNELDLVPAMVYTYSDQPATELKRQASNWTYDQKQHIFETYARQALQQPDGVNLLDKITYTFDLMTDFADYLAFIDASGCTTMRQALTPRFGYDMPTVIEKAGLSDEYERCFDLSLALYSQLQEAGYRSEAEYATLLGHRLRWSASLAAPDLAEICNIPNDQTSALVALGQSLVAAISEAHPLLARTMATATTLRTGNDVRDAEQAASAVPSPTSTQI